MSDSVFVLPINLTIVMFTNPIGAYLLKRLSPKLMLLMATAFAVVTALAASTASTFATFCLVYPTLFGLTVGAGYLPPLSCGWQWLPTRKGLATGMILGAFGFGSFVFSFVALAVINPDNVKAEVYDGQKLYPPEVAIKVSHHLLTVLRFQAFSVCSL